MPLLKLFDGIVLSFCYLFVEDFLGSEFCVETARYLIGLNVIPDIAITMVYHSVSEYFFETFEVVNHLPRPAALLNPFLPEFKTVHIFTWINIVASQFGYIQCNYTDVIHSYLEVTNKTCSEVLFKIRENEDIFFP